MKREAKIDRAAEKYAEGYPNAILVYRAFKDGASYADRHPAKKDPAKKQTATIDAWVARDMNKDLYVYDKEPHEFRNEWLPNDTVCTFLKVDCALFQEVTFKNSPKKVKVTIEMEEEQ